MTCATAAEVKAQRKPHHQVSKTEASSGQLSCKAAIIGSKEKFMKPSYQCGVHDCSLLPRATGKAFRVNLTTGAPQP